MRKKEMGRGHRGNKEGAGGRESEGLLGFFEGTGRGTRRIGEFKGKN